MCKFDYSILLYFANFIFLVWKTRCAFATRLKSRYFRKQYIISRRPSLDLVINGAICLDLISMLIYHVHTFAFILRLLTV